MRIPKCAVLALLMAIISLFGLSSGAWAFHEGGAASCGGCHTMHAPAPLEKPGRKSSPASRLGSENPFLLKGSDPSSTCLECHAKEYKVLSKDGSAYTPGGDFFWLTKSFNAHGDGQDYQSPGDSHGHNIIALDFGLTADATLVSAPGDGSVDYRSRWLSCTSCHDPHGKNGRVGKPQPISGSGSYGEPASPKADSGNYRLLGGVGYRGGFAAAGIRFTHPAPVAKTYPGADGQWPAETDHIHVDYGSGMSEWCSNCHPGMGSTHGHPSGNGVRLGNLADNYNLYVSTANLSGTHGTSYDHFVPFERGETDESKLNPYRTDGPTPHSNVMCLTCHRAHASPYAKIGRWDFESTFLAESPVQNSPEGVHAFYGEDIATRYNPYQRSLCNKCHVQD